MFQRIQYLVRVLLGYDPYLKIQYNCKALSYGIPHAKWTIYPDQLSKNKIAYCFGIGDDVSFDLSLISNFGMKIFAFDPTPRSVNWIKSQKFPNLFKYFFWGLASFDGKAYFEPPEKINYISYKITNKLKSSNELLPVYKLSTIMNKLGHKKIDILKLNIEGQEFKVLEQILKDKINIDQILVEFHHRFAGFTKKDTKYVVNKLNKSGYKIFYISGMGSRVSFIKK